MDINESSPISTLLAHSQLRRYSKGQIIIYQGDKPANTFILKQGEVKLYDIDEHGNEKILHILRAPTIFPLTYHFCHEAQTSWFYAALTDTQVHATPYVELESSMRENGDLAVNILKTIATESHELLVRIDSMSKTSAQAKLVAALKFLAVNHSHVRRSIWRRVRFPISHQLLADMTGITRESITMAMQQLQEDKTVRYPKVTILEINFDKLIKL